jgi:hypothetical protein
MTDDQKCDRRRIRLRREEKGKMAKAKRRKVKALDLRKRLRDKSKAEKISALRTPTERAHIRRENAQKGADARKSNRGEPAPINCVWWEC